MPDIRYVCLSDLHLGEEGNLLTNLRPDSSDVDPMKPSKVLVQLVECLRNLISKNENQAEKPTLILNGDLLELALTTTNQTAMAFERFVELAMPEGNELFKNPFIFLAGNHDHHLWEIARESQYVDYMVNNIKPGQHFPIPWHVTKMFNPTRVTTYFLTRLIQRFKHLKDMEVHTAYPNYGLLSEDRQKCIIFHHGHFIESMYQLMSTLRKLIFGSEMPDNVWDIEAQNFAWIDFFWSTMGRSGEVGEDVEVIYEKMQDPDEFKELLSGMVDNLARLYNLPGVDVLTAKVLKWILRAGVDWSSGMERKQTEQTDGAPLSESSREGLTKYMEGPLLTQILDECDRNMPADVTFIFGHTHKPFQKDMNFNGYPQWVNVYNSGGWIVDTLKPEPLIGGSIILVDEDLNTTALRMYNQKKSSADYSVSVEEARHTGEESNPLYKRISELVKPSEEPWKTFSEEVACDVPVRIKHLQDKIIK